MQTWFVIRIHLEKTGRGIFLPDSLVFYISQNSIQGALSPTALQGVLPFILRPHGEADATSTAQLGVISGGFVGAFVGPTRLGLISRIKGSSLPDQ